MWSNNFKTVYIYTPLVFASAKNYIKFITHFISREMKQKILFSGHNINQLVIRNLNNSTEFIFKLNCFVSMTLKLVMFGSNLTEWKTPANQTIFVHTSESTLLQMREFRERFLFTCWSHWVSMLNNEEDEADRWI